MNPRAAAVRALLLCGGMVGTVRAELPVPAAAWATLGQATREIAGNAMTIHQHSDKAILNWQSFDVGQGNAVHFKQPSAASIALNRIAPGDHPSQILGSIDANGQVYLLNPNGFVFGPKSQVNVNSLVATTLNISDETFKAGLTKAINGSQGSEPVAALSGDGAVYRRDAQGRTLLDADGKPLKIAIETQAGTKIATNAAGGRILLVAPSIVNQGSVNAPDGQVVLAAATDKVYLQEADPQSNLRGILVEVKTGGDVRNLGKLAADRGNVTALGYMLEQQGRVSASTAVSLNGSVRLLAREGGKIERGSDGTIHLVPGTTRRAADLGDGLGTQATVTLGAGGKTRIGLDASKGAAVDEQAQQPSRVEIAGGKIVLESGAAITAPGGKVALTASENPAHPLLATRADNASRIVLEKGSRIDVAGSRKTVLPMSRNVVSVELRDNELRDSPLQKDGILHGKTVQVDIRKGTPLADISGAVARIKRSVDERNSTGGSVSLDSEGDVLFGQGALVDVSGGAVRYQDGVVKTTQLVAGDRVYDIADADPNRHYDAILGQFSLLHPSWHITQTWDIRGPIARGRFEQGYTEGKSAGSLNIQARDVALDGAVRAKTVADRYQRETAQRPEGGSLSIDLAWSGQRQQAVEFRDRPAPLNLSASAAFPGASDGGPLPSIVLGNEVFRGGVQKLEISSAGRISIAKETKLALPVTGSLSLTGGSLAVDGTISAPSGTIALNTRLASGEAESLSGDIQIGAGASLSTSGLWINDQPGSFKTPDPVALPIAGGEVSILSVGGLALAPGSRIAADGGAWLQKNGKVVAGPGGDIALGVAGNGPTRLELGADLSAHGLSQGGSLAITANAIRVGSDAPPADSAASLLNLSPEFLNHGGFGKLALTANGGDLSIAPGTAWDSRAETWQLDSAFLSKPTGTPLESFGQTTLQPEYFRTPVDLSLTVNHDVKVGAYDPGHALNVGAGASITTDPGGQIALNSDANIKIDGTLAAPAGKIALTLSPVNSTLDRGYDPNQAIRLGPSARLLAPGAALLQPSNSGLLLGEVKPGGTVALTAHRGYVLMDRSALIDVSGTAASLDIPVGNHGQYARKLIPSDGGSIELTAAEGTVPDGKLMAQAGAGPGASGGGLSLTLDARARGFPLDNLPADALPIPTGPRVIHLADGDTHRLAAGAALDGEIPAALNGQAYLSAEQVKQGGFATLSLKSAVAGPDTPAFQAEFPKQGSIDFVGDVNLTLAKSLTLDAPVLNWTRRVPGDIGDVRLAASVAVLGSSLNRVGYTGTQAGDGVLRIDADWVDLLGATELRGFRQTAITSRNDIRLLGINPNGEGSLLGQFSAAGEIDLDTRQIYPGTLSQFAIGIDAAQSPDGLIKLLPGDAKAKAPLSAGGKLSLSAANISSLGVLRAPMGEIDLRAGQSLDLAAGSVTSVSARGLTIPFGRTQGGLDWLFPLGTNDLVMDAPPEKTIQLAGKAVSIQAGAKVDLSGGGDLQAFEFIKGPGGSTDQLDPTDPGYADGSSTYREKYAVVPWLGSRYAPYDPIDFPASGLHRGDSIYLGAGSGLAAGRYALLPAHYALLPGAFLVTPETGTTDMPGGTHYARLDGSPVVSGYRYTADTPFRDARTGGYTVEPGGIARTRSEYDIHRANAFYAEKSQAAATAAALLPMDAGGLAITAGTALELAGSVSAAGNGNGRGGRMDIAADRLRIVQSRDQTAAQTGASVALAADDLNRLQVESLLIGGRRNEDNGETRVDLESSEVSVGPGVRLQGREIILVAKDGVDVGAGAMLTAQGKAATDGGTLRMGLADGAYTGGAMLRLSTGSQADLRKDPLADAPHTGNLGTGAGAVLSAGGSMLLDGTVDNRLQGSLHLNGGALALGAGHISLGNAPASTPGLVLGDALLGQLKVDELRLASLSSLDIYGAATVSAKNLRIESAGLRGHGGAGQTTHITADTVSFSNPDAATAESAPTAGLGDLAVTAKQIQIGPGDQVWSGFHHVAVSANDALFAVGRAFWRVDSDTLLSTGKFTAQAGANLALDAGSHSLAIDSLAGGSPARVAEGLGACLNIKAGSISVAAPIVLPAGSLNLAANGDISLNKGAVLDIAGRAVTLGGKAVYAAGGVVALDSARGNIAIAPGARVNVAADSGGGDAGSLDIAAGQGRVVLDGALAGQAGKDGVGGSFSLDTQGFGLPNFSALNAKLRAAGFDQSLTLRLRRGDIAIARGDGVNAHALSLSADAGSITLSGTVNAGGAQGGEVRLNAGQSVLLSSTARIRANATATGGDGGRVELSALGNGSLASGVHIEAGASIDVSPGAGGAAGGVSIRAGRVGADDAALDIAGNVVTGASSLSVEAVRVYRDVAAALTNADIAGWYADTAAYMDAAGGNAALQTRLGGFTLTPGLEIQSSGDLNLDLGGAINGHAWTPTGTANVWATRLEGIAGPVGGVAQIGSDGAARTLTAGASSQLTADGSYYFDADPASPTFRELFVRVFPGTGLTGANRYDPARIKDSLVEANGWDLSFPNTQGASWRFGPEQTPGGLSLRAAGDLTIAQNLSDGFATYNARSLASLFQIDGPAPNWLDTLLPQPGFSWTYRLVAGADLNGADTLATTGTPHHLVVGAGATVRTGTGDIDAAASGDIRLTDAGSTIYTAGRPTDAQRYGSFGLNLASKAFYAEYPIDGGNLRLSAGRDIIGAATPQFMSDWLVRTGSWNPDDGLDAKDRPTAWGIAFDNLVIAKSANAQIQNLKFGFRENIGALGGGDVTVRAGGSVRDLSAMLPTTAKPTGAVVDGQIVENTWKVRGGGDLSVTAGGDIAGGVFYVERGTANLTAHGAVTGGSQYTAGPVFALGDTRFQVNAGLGIAVGAVLNPFAVTAPKYTDKTAYFSTYSADSALALQTAAGEVALNNDAAVIQQAYQIYDGLTPAGRAVLSDIDETRMLTLYPGSLQAHALSGGLSVGHSFDLFPAAAGRLELLGYGDIRFDASEQVVVNQSDADPGLMLPPTAPTVSLNDTAKRLDIFNLANADFLHAAVPVHSDDTQPVLVASEHGDILSAHASLLSTAKPAEISAGRDIVGLGLQIQNLRSGDVSEIRAGRDIRFPITRDPLTGELDSNIDDLPLSVSGPGQFQILAGRDLDLGTSAGITTLGNLTNPALPSGGASISVWAGLSEAPDYRGFIKTYLQGGYAEPLTRYMRALTGDSSLDSGAALAQFEALPATRRRELILAVLFRELKAAGLAAAQTTDPAQRAAFYRRGENAIAALLPGQDYHGNIKLIFSKIQTLDGGDIQLMAPGGWVDVGLASAFSGAKTAADLGIVAQRTGHIAALSQGDFRVNQSRVFTLGGGDIILWSERGDIDAGRGAKAALATPAPSYGFDAKGNLVVDFPPSVSGSGIRAQSGFTGTDIGGTETATRPLTGVFGDSPAAARFGDVTLVAPHGVVNTGEAGIGGKNVAIAATAIIGVANIQATGSLTGAPPPMVSVAAGLVGAGNLAAGAGNAAQTALNESLAADSEPAQAIQPPPPVSQLSAELVGFGNCSLGDIRQGSAGCR